MFTTVCTVFSLKVRAGRKLCYSARAAVQVLFRQTKNTHSLPSQMSQNKTSSFKKKKMEEHATFLTLIIVSTLAQSPVAVTRCRLISSRSNTGRRPSLVIERTIAMVSPIHNMVLTNLYVYSFVSEPTRWQARIQGVGAGAGAHPWDGDSPLKIYHSIAFKHTRRPPL